MRKGLSTIGAGLFVAVAFVAGCGTDSASSPSGSAGANGSSGGTGGISGSAGGTGGAPAVEPRSMLAACRAYLRATCERRYECGMNTNAESCMRPFWYMCPDYLFAPGSARTAEGMFACAEQFATHDCEVFGRGINPSCAGPGTALPGDPCVSPIQCASFSCNGVAEAYCGSCRTAVGVGEACNPESDACPEGYTCDGTCVESPGAPFPPPQDRAPGEACASNDRCPEGYLCSQTGTSPTGVCALPLQIGEVCIESGMMVGTCADTAYCDPDVSACVPRAIAGDPCGLVGTAYVTCAPNHVCDGFSPTQEQGTCVALIPAGSPCDDPSDSSTVGYGFCQSDLACAPDGICKEMILEGYPCPEPGALAFCEVRTSCVDGVCTADDTFALFDSLCTQS